MKINLLLDNDKDILSGYVNVDPCAPEGTTDRVLTDVSNFDSVCDDAEAEEIVAREILAYFPAKDVDGILSYWLRKLRHGGVLKIMEIDLLAASKAVANQTLSLEEANLLLYGHQNKPWQYRKCLLTVQQVAEVLQNKGLEIVKKSLDQFQFLVEARRP